MYFTFIRNYRKIQELHQRETQKPPGPQEPWASTPNFFQDRTCNQG